MDLNQRPLPCQGSALPLSYAILFIGRNHNKVTITTLMLSSLQQGAQNASVFIKWDYIQKQLKGRIVLINQTTTLFAKLIKKECTYFTLYLLYKCLRNKCLSYFPAKTIYSFFITHI